uniref:Uncharacterized protein n=1 Tax=Arundo donax TaxID=35708 RepID=A0A0A9AYQ1_ARUDO
MWAASARVGLGRGDCLIRSCDVDNPDVGGSRSDPC